MGKDRFFSNRGRGGSGGGGDRGRGRGRDRGRESGEGRGGDGRGRNPRDRRGGGRGGERREPADSWSQLLKPSADNDFLEKTACPACGETAARVHGRLGPTNLKQCRACGVRYVSPRLSESVREEMALRAPKGMDSPRNLMLRHLMAERLQNMHREMFSLEGMARDSASLLEVGSAWGHFLQLCRPHYRSVDGIELSKEQATFARERFDLEVSRVDIFKEPWPGRHHVICAWESLDHLPYPTQFLSWAHEHLLPGGQLVLAVPNYDSLFRRLLRTRWFHFDPARRLTYWTAPVIKEHLRKAGFTDIAVFSSGSSQLRERFNAHNQVDRSGSPRDQWLETLRIRERIEAERDRLSMDKGSFMKRAWNSAVWWLTHLALDRGLGDELRIYARR